MVTPNEQQWRSLVDSLTHEANVAQKISDTVALKRIYSTQIEPLSKIAQMRAHDYDFGNAEMALERMRELQGALSPLGNERERAGIEVRVLYTEAIICDVRGTYNLFEKLQFVDAPVELEKAEKRYQRVAQLSEALDVPSLVVNGVTGMGLRAKGIRLFGQGRFNIEAANLKIALIQLGTSKVALEEAARHLQPSADAGQFGAESAMYPGYCTSLAASAAAFGCRCEADGKAFAGKYAEAAHLLATQLAMMEKSKQGLLNIISKVADTLAHRTAQEMELCDKRQRFFATLPSGSTVTRATLLFAALMLAAFLCQVGALKFMGAQMDKGYYIAIMSASLVVAGIGAGLTTWDRGTKYFQEVGAGRIGKVTLEDGEK